MPINISDWINENMKKTICVGDKTSHGGSVLTGSSQIIIDGKSVARKSDLVSCPTHGVNSISEGDKTLR